MLRHALQFLLDVVEWLLVFPALLRFYLQAFRVPFRNPLSEFVVALTDFAVKPLRRVIPGLYGLDLSSFFLAWSVELVLQLLSLSLKGHPVLTGGPQVLPIALFLALLQLARYSLYLLMVAVFVQAILSWFSSYNSVAPVLDSLTRPFLGPIKRFLPPIGGVDLSPLVVFVACQLILMLPLNSLEFLARKML
jgi:YggT family protein